MKRELTIFESFAVEGLIALVRDINLFEEDADDDYFVHTTGQTLNLESFPKDCWEKLLNLINEDEESNKPSNDIVRLWTTISFNQ